MEDRFSIFKLNESKSLIFAFLKTCFQRQKLQALILNPASSNGRNQLKLNLPCRRRSSIFYFGRI